MSNKQSTKDALKIVAAKKLGAKAIEIPVPINPWPILIITVPMTTEVWNQMMEMLEKMKPALVEQTALEELKS